MSKQLKKNWSFIQILIQTSYKQRLAILKTLTDEQLGVLCEIVLNTLQGHLYVPPDIVKKLKRNKKFYRGLISKDIGKAKKKINIVRNPKLIIQLLETVHPLLATYVTE